MQHVFLHHAIDTQSHRPAHTRPLDQTPRYTRLWPLACTEGTNDERFHFHLSSGGQYRHEEASSQAKQLACILPCFWRRPLEISLTVWETTITDNCDIRWVQLQSPSPSSIALTMYNGQPRWPYISSRKKCMVSSKDTMTSWESQLQTRPLQRRPFSTTGWIAIVMPDQVSCWAWSREYKRNTWSSMMQRRFGKT